MNNIAKRITDFYDNLVLGTTWNKKITERYCHNECSFSWHFSMAFFNAHFEFKEQ